MPPAGLLLPQPLIHPPLEVMKSQTGQNANNNPLYVVAKKFELLQHVVDHYKKPGE
jgi:hypothetical protein